MTMTKTIPSPPTGVKPTRTYPELVAIVLINEILPRIKRFKKMGDDDDFKDIEDTYPAIFCGLLCFLEYEKIIDRRTLRRFLDDHIEWVKAGRPRDPEEDKALLEYISNKELL